MSAPLQKSSGAPVAQTICATGEFAPRINPAAQARATAALPVAQQQQAGLYPSQGKSGQTDNAAAQQKDALK